jgi:hypothetical protein
LTRHLCFPLALGTGRLSHVYCFERDWPQVGMTDGRGGLERGRPLPASFPIIYLILETPPQRPLRGRSTCTSRSVKLSYRPGHTPASTLSLLPCHETRPRES